VRLGKPKRPAAQLVDDHTTPHNLQAERAVLGAVLIENAMLAAATTVLRPEHFFRVEHQRLYGAMLHLAARGDVIDLIMLRARLSADDLERIGGPSYLAGLMDGVPRSTNVSHYAQLVKNAADARLIVAYARSAIALFTREPDALVNGMGATFVDTLRRAIDAAHLGAPLPAALFRTAAAIADDPASQVAFIAAPYIAAGCMTELTAKIKLGKTTLLAHASKCITANLPFLGSAVVQTNIVWLTEERMPTFRETLERAGLLESDRVSVLSYWDVVGRPWPQIMDLARAEGTRTAARVIIVDTLPQFSGLKGDEENNAGHALEALQPLQRAAAEGFAVVYTRHERKSGGEVGDSARGSSGFGGAADIVLALQRPEGRQKPTLRVIRALSRFNETPMTLVVEKVPAQLVDGVWAESFVALGNGEAAATHAARAALEKALPAEAVDAVTEKALESVCPGLTRQTMQRVLKDVALKTGLGKKGDPYRYFKPVKDSAQTPDLDGQNESEASRRARP
jgi:hypothetical protein